MQSDKFFVYLNIDPFPTAWAVYRGQMCSASSIGTNEHVAARPLAYWPYGLLRRAAAGCKTSLLRLEKEIAAEQVRRANYPNCVSRLHGIYVWSSEEDAFRSESKWRLSEGQHFERECLVEVGFTYTNLTRADTQWIDHFLINNDAPLDRNDLSWAHSYWRGDQWDASPHWEFIVEGRGVIWCTAMRMKALERIKFSWPHLIGQLELARLAADCGSDLYTIAPFIFANGHERWRADFLTDVNDENAEFMIKVGKHIQSIDKGTVNWQALELLRSENQKGPDLRDSGFDFDISLLTSEGRSGLSTIVSSRDAVTWDGFNELKT